MCRGGAGRDVDASWPHPSGDGTAMPKQHDQSVVLHAAQLYYRDELNQDSVAEQLGISRATVSRLLSEARRQGIVRIEVVAPHQADDDELARQVASRLGLQQVWVARGVPGTSCCWPPGAPCTKRHIRRCPRCRECSRCRPWVGWRNRTRGTRATRSPGTWPSGSAAGWRC